MEGRTTLTFVSEAANIIFLGPPGVGKTHLAVALGLRAIEHGFGVYFVRAQDLFEDLRKAPGWVTFRSALLGQFSTGDDRPGDRSCGTRMRPSREAGVGPSAETLGDDYEHPVAPCQEASRSV